tara:strand:+ start:2405 stop:2602 length:198 start_codon:yes stop_codon:yes gene_type:complete
MFAVILLIGSVFVNDNPEFIDAVKKDYDEGKTWSYVGEQAVPENGVAIPAIDSITGEEVVYFITK